MNQGRAHISSRYQEYPAVDAATLQAEAIPRQLALLDRIIKLVERCDRRVDLLQRQMALPNLLQHDNRIDKVWRAAREMQRYGQNVTTILQQYPRLDLKQTLALPTATSLTNTSESLALDTDRLTAQPPTTDNAVQKSMAKLLDRTLSLVKWVAVLKSLLGEHRANLMLEQRARQARIVRPKRSRALFEEEKEEVQISSVLERFKEKGWRVDLRRRDREVKPNEPEDAFDLSLSLLERIKRPIGGLLEKDKESGIVRFPVVMRVNSRMSDHLIKLCTGPSVGYNLYVVFGGYVAIDNVVTLGIRHELVETEDRHHEMQLDFELFRKRLPREIGQYIGNPLIQNLQPVQPTRLTHHHYYTLMLPHGTLGESRHTISDWTFLTA